MLPPVFYVQQLEQILLRKLLSPPTPANPARFGPAPRCRAYIHIQFFSFAFFRSVFSCQAMSLWSRVSALRTRRTYINIQFLSALSISGRAPLAPRSSYSVFSFFRFSSIRYFRPGLLIFLYGESTSITCKSDSPVWCPSACNEGKKIFRLDIFARRIIMKIARDAATSGQPES